MSEDSDPLGLSEIEAYANAYNRNALDAMHTKIDEAKAKSIPPDYDHSKLHYLSPLADATLERIAERVGGNFSQITFVELQQIIGCEIDDAKDQQESVPSNAHESYKRMLNKLRQTEDAVLKLLTEPTETKPEERLLIKAYINRNIYRNSLRQDATEDETQRAKFQTYEYIWGSFLERFAKVPTYSHYYQKDGRQRGMRPPATEDKEDKD